MPEVLKSSDSVDENPVISLKTSQRRLQSEFLAEVYGTTIMMLLGNSVVASSFLQSGDDFSKNLFINTGWGFAVALAILVSYDISGAHLNPVVTLINMFFSGMSATRGAVYIAAQFTGSALGAALVALNFTVFKGQDYLANYFATAPHQSVNIPNAVFQEMLATAILLVGICAITSSKPSRFTVAAGVGLLIFGIGNSFGVQTGYAMNPARDFAPRVVWCVLSLIYQKPQIWSTVFMSGYFLVPMLAPIVGGFVGVSLHRYVNASVNASEEETPCEV